MSFIYIEFEEDEHIFDDVNDAEEFLLAHRQDGNEFYLTWKNEDGDIIEEEGWLYQAGVEDESQGEFKISPDAALGDYDKNCQWISSDPDEGDVYEALAQFL